jgi:serine/threonine protein kinase
MLRVARCCKVLSGILSFTSGYENSSPIAFKTMQQAAILDQAQAFIGQNVASYTLTRVIGAGQSSVIFEAKDQGKRIAIKVYDESRTPQFVSRLQLASEHSFIDHNIPHLVKMLGTGVFSFEETDYNYVLLEYLEGHTLMDRILDKNYDSAFIKEFIGKFCRITEDLTRTNVIHCDIKPENIMIDNEGDLRLIDLGLMYYPSPETHRISEQLFITEAIKLPWVVRRTLRRGQPIPWQAYNLFYTAQLLNDMVVMMKQCSPKDLMEFGQIRLSLLQAMSREINANSGKTPLFQLSLLTDFITLLRRRFLSLTFFNSFRSSYNFQLYLMLSMGLKSTALRITVHKILLFIPLLHL